MKTSCAMLLTALLGAAAPAFADDLDGLVRVTGSAIETKTVLTPEGEYKGPSLCASDVEKRVRHLSGLVVKVTGSWQLNKSGGKKCFDTTSFSVVRMTSGRGAVVGVLSLKDGVYVVDGDDGKATKLADIPDGLKKMTGQKVLLDVKPVQSPNAKESNNNIVVTYQSFP